MRPFTSIHHWILAWLYEVLSCLQDISDYSFPPTKSCSPNIHNHLPPSSGYPCHSFCQSFGFRVFCVQRISSFAVPFAVRTYAPHLVFSLLKYSDRNWMPFYSPPTSDTNSSMWPLEVSEGAITNTYQIAAMGQALPGSLCLLSHLSFSTALSGRGYYPHSAFGEPDA